MPTLAVLAPLFSAAGAAGSTFWVTMGSTARAGPKAAASAIAIPEILKVPGRFMVRLRRCSTPERPLVADVGRVVGAVDIGVAIQAAARQRVGAGAGPGKRGEVAAMAGGLVALLAKHRLAQLQQVGRSGAVRVVAVRAVLLHRLVRAHEGPALLHVAAVAGVVDGVAQHHGAADRPVRVVAVGARNQPFPDRVARRAVDFRALHLVACEAHLWLGELVAHPVERGMTTFAPREGA